MPENADVSSETPTETEPSAATVVRDQLLYAIGREAESVAKDQAGNVSAALVELARAYALTTARTSNVTGELHLTGVEMVMPGDETEVFVGSLATVVRDQVLRAVGAEAANVSEAQPGNASAALVELARAYALVTGGLVARTVGQPWMSLLVFHEGEQSEGPDALGISTER